MAFSQIGDYQVSGSPRWKDTGCANKAASNESVSCYKSAFMGQSWVGSNKLPKRLLCLNAGTKNLNRALEKVEAKKVATFLSAAIFLPKNSDRDKDLFLYQFFFAVEHEKAAIHY